MINRRKRKRGNKNQDISRYLRFMIIPFILIIIVVVIMLMDHMADGINRNGSATPSDATPSDAFALTLETEAGEPDNKQYEVDFSDFELQKDQDSDLYQLVADYCQAKMESNVELLCQVFNNSEMREDEKAEKKAEMDLEKKYVDGYENISCYYVKGPEPDSFIIYPYFEIKFRGAEVAIPCLTLAYAQKNEEGSYYMSYIFSEELSEYIAKANAMEDVRLLSAQIDAKIEEAIAQDEVLQNIYGSINTAPDVSEREVEISASEASEAENLEQQSTVEETSEPETLSADGTLVP